MRVRHVEYSRRLRGLLAAMAAMVAVSAMCACARRETGGPTRQNRQPNILWIVWDTVRADHLSLYGYSKPTTPFLKKWAANARVFENCFSTAGSTIPSHASMFTGLLPSEHGTHAEHTFLDDRHTTIAEILKHDGYQTFLYSANPNISKSVNFHQGFEVEEHPWDKRYRSAAIRIVQRKIASEVHGGGLLQKIRAGRETNLGVEATGGLNQRALIDWLNKRNKKRPYFAFLNYMEAHQPLIPAKEYRLRMMSAPKVEKSYKIDGSWRHTFLYTFGLDEYSDEKLEIMAATYDATLLELDELFQTLIETLEARGDLENTVVILTADHGEHLGEHHMLDHHYSVYQPLIHVPLVVHYQEQFKRGRETRPVVTFDIFPTLLELAGIDPPIGFETKAVSLLEPRADRIRLAEYVGIFNNPFEFAKSADPNWNPSPWNRELRALIDGPFKYVWASDGRNELYDLDADPLEERNLVDRHVEVRKRLASTLDACVASILSPGKTIQTVPPLSPEQRRRLESLGYLQGSDGASETAPE